MSVTYKHERPALAVDCVVFGFEESELKILLIRRDEIPYEGRWALPGSFVRIEETLDEAARRALARTGVEKVYLEQLYSFSDVDRDKRERVISVAYYALVKLSDYRLESGDEARNASWFPVSRIPALAFDHERIIKTAIERLRGKVRYQPIGFELLPKKFTLSQLQRLYEIVLQRDLDKRNFRKKILGMELLEELDEVQRQVAHRAARLYRFDQARYRELLKRGFNFEL